MPKETKMTLRAKLPLLGLATTMLFVTAAFGQESSTDDVGVAVLAELETAGLLARFDLDAAGRDQAAANPRTLEGHLLLALSRNQELRSRYRKYDALRAGIDAASALPDPRLGYTEFIEPVETRVGPQERVLSLTQAVPWFGSLGLRGEMKRRQSEAARAQFLGEALAVIADVKKAWYDLGYLDEAIRITGEHRRLLEAWERAAQARYTAGTGRYADLVKAQVELGILDDSLARWQDRHRPLTAVLDALLDREPTATAVIVATAGLPDELPATESLVSLMLANNPALAVWDHRAQQSRDAVDLAGKSGLPSFQLGVNWIGTGPARMDGVTDSGKDAWSATLAVSLPIWRGKIASRKAEAAGGVQSALALRRSAANDLRASLAEALFQFRDARRRAVLYRSTLLPKGRQAQDAARSAYESGDGGFLDLVDAQRRLLEFELTAARAGFDALTQAARIEKLIATSLPAAIGTP